MSIFDSTDFNFDTLGAFEDEIDAAIVGTGDLEKAEKELEEKKKEGCLYEADEDIDDIDDLVDDDDDILDPNYEYDKNGIVGTDIEDVDADDLIAADRELMLDPFEDDELIDAATDNEEPEDLDEE